MFGREGMRCRIMVAYLVPICLAVSAFSLSLVLVATPPVALLLGVLRREGGVHLSSCTTFLFKLVTYVVIVHRRPC